MANRRYNILALLAELEPIMDVLILPEFERKFPENTPL